MADKLAFPDNIPQKFVLGQTTMTPNARDSLSHEDVMTALARDVQGDWGDVDRHDRAAKDEALLHGERLFSVYHSSATVKFWIITEADRTFTTVLLPEDY
jgi:hypothetical protein